MTDQEMVKEIQDRIPHLSQDDLRAIYQITGKLIRASVRNTIKDKADGKAIFYMDFQMYLMYDTVSFLGILNSLLTYNAKIYIIVSTEIKMMARNFDIAQGNFSAQANIATVKKMEKRKGGFSEKIIDHEAIVFVEELPKSVKDAIPVANTGFDFFKAIQNVSG